VNSTVSSTDHGGGKRLVRIGWENFDGQVMIIEMKRAATFKHGVSLMLSVIQ
jgi:hypothetical protein